MPAADPPTPKARHSKSKGRARSSPSQKKSSPALPATPNASSVAVAAAAAAAAAAQGTPYSTPPNILPQVPYAHRPNVITNQKRARSGNTTPKESDTKRAKAATAAALSAAAAAAATRQVKPGSPTTSSRSRPRRPVKARNAEDATNASHILAAATSATASQRSRPPQRSRGATTRAPPLPQFMSCFSVDGSLFSSSVKPVTLQKRLFGHEIQCLMHAFGEVRYCAREVLEIMEDTVRDIVCRVAVQAQKNASEESSEAAQSAHMLANAQVDGTARVDKPDHTIKIRHVARCFRGDPRAIQRLNQSLKHSWDLHQEKMPQDVNERTFVPTPKPWDVIADLGLLTPERTVTAAAEKANNSSDMMSICSWRALHAFRTVMGSQHFQDFVMCRGVTLVRQASKSRALNVREQPRIALFREWLNFPTDLNRHMPDSTLFALGHVAWEVIGLITQTALLHRYFDDLDKGYGDPRASSWTYSRHLVAALNYGLGTAILVPLTDVQATVLRQEIDSYLNVLQAGSQRWRGYSRASSPCLLPHHIKEAIRRLERSPDSPFGFRESSFLLTPGLL